VFRHRCAGVSQGRDARDTKDDFDGQLAPGAGIGQSDREQ
jgi:hypothetical protein